MIVKFGEKYKQWNAAFDAGYAAALNKSIIVIHNEEHQHALKEVDASAAAVAKDQNQAFRILKYILHSVVFSQFLFNKIVLLKNKQNKKLMQMA